MSTNSANKTQTTMAKELNEDSGIKVSVKTLIAIAVAITTAVSFWFAFQAQLDDMRDEIEDAKTLPAPNISRTEYELKDELVRSTILNTQEGVCLIVTGIEWLSVVHPFSDIKTIVHTGDKARFSFDEIDELDALADRIKSIDSN